MRVKSCVASDGGGHIIKLSDEFGCVLRPKMISQFLKARAPDEKATVLTYAFFHAFKFPDALSVHVKCKVEICRHGCLDHCQTTGNSNERKDVIAEESVDTHAYRTKEVAGEHNLMDEFNDHFDDENEESFYEDETRNDDPLATMLRMTQQRNNITNVPQNILRTAQQPHSPAMNLLSAKSKLPPSTEPPTEVPTQRVPETETPVDDTDNANDVAPVREESFEDLLPNDLPMHEMLRKTYLELKKPQDEKFPHGPRTLVKDRMGMPPVAGPRSLNIGEEVRPRMNRSGRAIGRTRRSVTVSDRKVRSADVGVSGIYEVISQQDLEFSPDSKQEAVTVFQGQIAEEIVYGICMPVPGFSILFILIASTSVVSTLIAGSLLYRYQIQKSAYNAQKTAADMTQESLASWMMFRLFHFNQNPTNDVVMK